MITSATMGLEMQTEGADVQVLLSSLGTLLGMLRAAEVPGPDSVPNTSPRAASAQACIFTVQVVLPKSGPVKMVPAPGEHKVTALTTNILLPLLDYLFIFMADDQ